MPGSHHPPPCLGRLLSPSRSGCLCSEDHAFTYSMNPPAQTACGDQLAACRAVSPVSGSPVEASHREREGLHRRKVVPSTHAQGSRPEELPTRQGGALSRRGGRGAAGMVGAESPLGSGICQGASLAACWGRGLCGDTPALPLRWKTNGPSLAGPCTPACGPHLSTRGLLLHGVQAPIPMTAPEPEVGGRPDGQQVPCRPTTQRRASPRSQGWPGWLGR